MDGQPRPILPRILVLLLALVLFGFCVVSELLLRRLFPWLPRPRRRRRRGRHH